MDENRIANIEAMVGELIRIVGNTNAMVEEMHDELRGLSEKVGRLETKVDDLHMEEDVYRLKRVAGIR